MTFAALVALRLDVMLPQHLARGRVHRRDGRFAVQDEDLAAVGDHRGHDLAGLARSGADVALPGDGEVGRGDDVLDRILGGAARQGPAGGRLGTRQEEVATGQGGRGRQLLFELQHRDALSGGGDGGVRFLAAEAEGQHVPLGGAGGGRHGHAADEGDLEGAGHGRRQGAIRHCAAACAAAWV
jgi:hypothetical protein